MFAHIFCPHPYSLLGRKNQSNQRSRASLRKCLGTRKHPPFSFQPTLHRLDPSHTKHPPAHTLPRKQKQIRTPHLLLLPLARTSPHTHSTPSTTRALHSTVCNCRRRGNITSDPKPEATVVLTLAPLTASGKTNRKHQHARWA